MKEKDLKETIGKKLEEAYLAKPMGQAPSEETVAKWIAIVDKRSAESRRRKRGSRGAPPQEKDHIMRRRLCSVCLHRSDLCSETA